MKLQLMNNKQYFMCLPNQIVRAKGWKKGDNIEFEIDWRGRIIIKKVENATEGNIRK